LQRLAQDGGGAKDGVAFGHGVRLGGGFADETPPGLGAGVNSGNALAAAMGY
jgi:hypothetical protein